MLTRQTESVPKTLPWSPLASDDHVDGRQEMLLSDYLAGTIITFSDYLHHWRYLGIFSDSAMTTQLEDELEIVADPGRFSSRFPESVPVIVEATGRYRIRWIASAKPDPRTEGEFHIHQFLAVCAEAGLPPDFRMTTSSGSVIHLSDLLEAARSDFYGSQQPYWSLIAFLGYFPGTPRWVNRFGETQSYESVVASILSTAPEGARCSPAHALLSLVHAVCCDDTFRIVSRSLRSDVLDRLQSNADVLRRTQEDDGALLLPSGPASTLTAELEDRLSETAHHLEWLYHCQQHVQIDRPTIARAVTFLGENATEQRVALMRMTYCTASHCARSHALWHRHVHV